MRLVYPVEGWRSAPRLLAAAALALGTAAPLLAGPLYIDAVPSREEADARFTGARFEPYQGCFLGAYVDLDQKSVDTYMDRTGIERRLPTTFERLTQKQHASYFFYLGYGRQAPVDWIAFLGMPGRIVHIALEPGNGFDYVLDNLYLRNLAKSLADTRTPILLRFASEMNGEWVPWHGNPKLYIEKFRMVSKVMKQYAPNVAMVWAPYASPVKPIPDYYPGDDVVDWVGVNIYNVTFFNQNPKTPGRHVGPTDMLDPIYEKYASRKPIIIAEYGATHFSKLENKANVPYAQSCIQSLYWALPRRYPRVKAVTYFNTNNLTLKEVQNNNYTVTDNPSVLKTYRSMISPPYYKSSLVEGDRTLAPQPVPLQNGRKVSGIITLSGWAPMSHGACSLRLKAGGRTVATAPDASIWQSQIDTTLLPNGPLVIEAEEISGRRIRARETVKVSVDN